MCLFQPWRVDWHLSVSQWWAKLLFLQSALHGCILLARRGKGLLCPSLLKGCIQTMQHPCCTVVLGHHSAGIWQSHSGDLSCGISLFLCSWCFRRDAQRGVQLCTGVSAVFGQEPPCSSQDSWAGGWGAHHLLIFRGLKQGDRQRQNRAPDPAGGRSWSLCQAFTHLLRNHGIRPLICSLVEED